MPRHLSLAAPLALLAACAPPRLYSADGDLPEVGSGSDWEAPENGWDKGSPPPAELEGEGFGVGQVLPDLRLLDQHGEETATWQWYGMVVAIDVSTMWCGPCRGLAAEVDATWADYRDQGFMYVTLLPQDQAGEVPDNADLNAWADQFGISAPVLSDDEGWSYQIVPDNTYPRIMIVGRDMRVLVDQVTPAEDTAIRAAIEAAL
ncbi:MAG: redoxin domain-containing protein [Deltaproteobacteria bacterium]|jgi:thiol-disulfide isomerase/thioredoxin|nr:redoxin domain-containing protein [Deltaproteobacteria bacterium]